MPWAFVHRLFRLRKQGVLARRGAGKKGWPRKRIVEILDEENMLKVG